MACMSEVNTSRRIRLLGQFVNVYAKGIVWVNPDTKQRFLLGKTRAEAEDELRRWKTERFGAFASCKVRSLPVLAEGDKIPKAYWRALYYARARAKRAGKAVMSAEEFAGIVQRADGRCEVSGIAFSDERPSHHRKAMWAPSIDRVDCRLGYELGNCRLVCVAVNIALNEFGVEVLGRIADAIGKRPLLPIPAK